MFAQLDFRKKAPRLNATGVTRAAGLQKTWAYLVADGGGAKRLDFMELDYAA